MDDVTNRFLEAYNKILSDGVVSDAKDFASKIDISTSMMTEIVKGRSNIGLKGIQNIVLRFSINPSWLITGQGEMFSNKVLDKVGELEKETKCKDCKLKDKVIVALEQQVLTQSKLIDYLENNPCHNEYDQKRKAAS